MGWWTCRKMAIAAMLLPTSMALAQMVVPAADLPHHGELSVRGDLVRNSAWADSLAVPRISQKPNTP